MKFYFIILFVCVLFHCTSIPIKSFRKPTSEDTEYFYPTDLDHFNWLKAKNGRTSYLFGTINPDKIQLFTPSGHSPEEKRIGQWKIILRHPIYYSNEENPNTLKDQPASAMVYKILNRQERLMFVGKGNTFSVIEHPAIETAPLFILRHWSGVMGCAFTDLEFHQHSKEHQLSVQYRDTSSVTLEDKVGTTCTPSVPSDHLDF